MLVSSILPFCSLAVLLLFDIGSANPNLIRRGQRVKRVIHETLLITQGTIWTDGNPRSNSVLINGTSPGPTLRFKVGDLALIKVLNEIPDNQNTTIHFHGLTQALLPSADGTPMISQWPIAPNTFFEYEMFFTQDEVGTTFFHSHVGVQILTAFAPLIVEDDQTPSIVPKTTIERIMILGDYFYASDQTLVKQLLGVPFVWPGSAQSISLNGKAWPSLDSCNQTIASLNGVDCDRSTFEGPEVIEVEYDKSYRFRWIGAQTLMHLAIGIFNHTQTIIAVDGEYIQPFQTNFIEIMAGQRYDTIIHTKRKKEVKQDGKKGCYLIRMETRWRKPATNGWALLRYPNAGQCEVGKQSPYPMNNVEFYLPSAEFGWISNQFHPLSIDIPSDQQVTRRIYLETQQVDTSTNGKPALRWDTNHQFYNESDPKLQGDSISLDTPFLIELYQGKKSMPSYERAMHPAPGIQIGYDYLTNTYVGKAGEVIDIVIINNSSAVNHLTETHPWHFHGQKHWTLAMGLGNFTEEGFEEAKNQFYPPILRDTTGVWPGFGASSDSPIVPLPNNSSGAWSVLRYRIPQDGSGTGVWMLHCHWSFHLVMGMNSLWVAGPIENTIQQRYSDPDYLYYGRNVSAPYSKDTNLSFQI